MPHLDAQFRALLSPNLAAAEIEQIPDLTTERARVLIDRIDRVRLFGHAYALLTNLTYGAYSPDDVLDFAREHDLAGVCIHVLVQRRIDLAGVCAPPSAATRAADGGG
ncbi:hypothetical protein [Streptomyces sp. NPDC001292]|uniref:hypothetical protein n=1 Tax=Streptomyces sp. NPDC001292 TaxID=3364558 RepID=UPI0036C5C180